MKVAIIDNFDSFVYNLVRYVREIEGVEVTVQRNNVVDYSILDAADAILLSPGPGIPDEAGDLKHIIKTYSGKKKILGVCLGLQAIAEVFGSELEPCPEPVHGKSSLINITNQEPLFVGLPSQLEVGRYHSWQVKSATAKGIEITAKTLDGIVMAIKHPEHPTTGVQFHPESMLTPDGRAMILNWIRS